jgi:ketosteroid isomerase-like protein
MRPAFIAAALAAGTFLLSQPATAEDPMTAQQFADARLAAFGAGDLDALMAQYAEDAMLFTASGVLQGRDQIRPVLAAALADFAQPGTSFAVQGAIAQGNTVAFVWSAETPTTHYRLGVESYVLAEGKAVYQTLILDAAPR